MKYTLHQNLNEYTGISSNLHGFLNQYLDTGFKSKWSGYWAPPYKFLDYYAIKVNGMWLGPSSLQATEYGENFVFHHETDSLEIKEKVDTSEKLPGFKIELEVQNKTDEKKAVHVCLEPGVDIRKVDQDIGPTDYEVEKGKNRLTVSNSLGKLMLTGDSFSVEGDSYLKEHHPGERQVCFIPGKISFRREIEAGAKETLNAEFTTSEAKFRSIESVDQDLKHPLDRIFSSSIDSMENLIYDRNGLGIIAGHPWFQSYWARDTFWTLLGLIDAGYFEISHEILQNFVERDLPGRISLEDKGEKESEREDTEPLFIIVADKLRRHYKISDEIETAMKDAMDELYLNGNIVNHSVNGTWMDTLERENAIDIQSLWLKAAQIMDDNREKKLRKGLKQFETEECLKDELEGGAETVNPAIPLMFDQIDPEISKKQLEKINGEFSSRYGARTRSAIDPGYDSSGYHTGSTWGLTTCWVAAANLRNGNTKQGENLLQKMEAFLDRNQPGALPEVVDSESGDLLGCPEQAWSAGLLVHVVDTYLLGINVKEDYVEVSPCDGVNADRLGKRVRGEKLDLEIVDGEAKVLNNPDLNIRIN